MSDHLSQVSRNAQLTAECLWPRYLNLYEHATFMRDTSKSLFGAAMVFVGSDDESRSWLDYLSETALHLSYAALYGEEYRKYRIAPLPLTGKGDQP